MEYRKTESSVCNPGVAQIQRLLNDARTKAYRLVENDRPLTGMMLTQPHYLQRIHHLEYVPSEWKNLVDDGIFGLNTEVAVRCLQKFLYITQNGIMGEYTQEMMRKLLDLEVANKSMITNSTRSKVSSLNPSLKLIADFFKSLFKTTQNVVGVGNAACFVLGNGFVIIAERNKQFVHINFNQIINDLLLPEYSRHGKWFRVNHNSRYRNCFTSFKVSKIAENTADAIGKVGQPLGIAGVVIETIDVWGKAFKGEAEIVDFASLSFNTLSTSVDFAMKNVSTIRLSVRDVVTKYGTEVVKWRFAAKVTGGTAAGIGAAGVAVVGIQCASVLLTGYEIGKWIESQTHWGEKTVNYFWELFIGDLVQKYYDWKVNKVVCIKYPPEWTEAQIQEFHSKFK